MQVIGLTGGIGSGKSTAAAYLRDAGGIPVIDADAIARDVLERPGATRRAVLCAFPTAVDRETGDISRPLLARAVFASTAARRRLEAIVHPAVRRAMLRALAHYWLRGCERVVLDVPLLFETGLHRFVSYTVVVAAGRDTQVERVVARGVPPITREDALLRIDAQMALVQKARLATVVVDNEGSVHDLHRQLDRLVIARRPSRVLHIGLFLLFPLAIALYIFCARVLSRL